MGDAVVHMTGVNVLDGTDSEGAAVLLVSLVNGRGDEAMVLLDRDKVAHLRDRLEQFLQSAQAQESGP